METQKICEDLVARYPDVLSLEDTSGWHKVVSKANGHRFVIQKGKLRRIDTTLPIKGQDGTEPLKADNGKITCHIKPDSLEKFVSVLIDPSIERLDSKPQRPFSPKAPKNTLRPTGGAVAPPQPAPGTEELRSRLEAIAAASERARKRRREEEAAEKAGKERQPVDDSGVDLSAPAIDSDLGRAALEAETGIDVTVD